MSVAAADLDPDARVRTLEERVEELEAMLAQRGQPVTVGEVPAAALALRTWLVGDLSDAELAALRAEEEGSL